jgi:hypothetical protein
MYKNANGCAAATNGARVPVLTNGTKRAVAADAHDRCRGRAATSLLRTRWNGKVAITAAG